MTTLQLLNEAAVEEGPARSSQLTRIMPRTLTTNWTRAWALSWTYWLASACRSWWWELLDHCWGIWTVETPPYCAAGAERGKPPVD